MDALMQLSIKKFEQENYKCSYTPSYRQCENVWKYGGKISLFARNLLNSIARSSYAVNPSSLKNVATHLKLLSIVSIPFSFVDLHALKLKIQQSLFKKDPQEFSLLLLSFTLTAADLLDSASTFTNTALILSSQRSMKLLSSMSLMFGFFLTGGGTIYRTFQIASALSLHHKVKDSFSASLKEKQNLIHQLETILKMPWEDISHSFSSFHASTLLKEQNKIEPSRFFSKEVLLEVEKLVGIIFESKSSSLSSQELENVFKGLLTIESHLEKKIQVELIGIMANLFAFSALTFFAMNVATSLPFSLMALAMAIRLLSLTYQEQKISPLRSLS